MSDFSYYKKIFLNNIDYLAKKNKKSRGDLEKAAKVSQGYLSRLEKADTKLTLDIVMGIANLFNVTPNTLLLKKLNDEQLALLTKLDFIEKLTEETKHNKIKWSLFNQNFQHIQSNNVTYDVVGPVLTCTYQKDSFIIFKAKQPGKENFGYELAYFLGGQLINILFCCTDDKINFVSELDKLHRTILASLEQGNTNYAAILAMQRFLKQ